LTKEAYPKKFSIVRNKEKKNIKERESGVVLDLFDFSNLHY
jgi:hypothetical protein